jgi:hypothetical protein
MRAQVLVGTKAPDPTARTAFATLTRRLGFAESLAALERRLYYEIDLREVRGDPRQALDGLLAETTLLANPNKEIARAWTEPDAVPLDGPAVLVWDREGARGAALEARIHRQHPALSGAKVRWGTLWLPTLRGPDDQRAPLVERMALADRRDSGLLANPNADRHAVFAGRVPHGTLLP